MQEFAGKAAYAERKKNPGRNAFLWYFSGN